MNGITHKHAINLIHRRLDGLLKESQLLSLEEHLRSCDSCRLYAAEMELLPAHLQTQFHMRWDEKTGPSQTVIEHVTTKARNIPMTNRISSGAKLFAGATALVVMAFLANFVISQLRSTSVSGTESNNNGPPVSSLNSKNRLLAFTSEQNGNLDIYTMHADGSGLMNITNNPANDVYPFWSPDGKRIAFTSDRDGSTQIYLMDADGSNLIQLTNGEGDYWFDVNGYTPWSPDGRKLIVFHKSPGEQNGKLYVIDIYEKTVTTLTNEPGQYLLPSWSPNGKHIAYLADTGRIPRNLFIVGSDGNHLTKLTENLPSGEFFMFDYDWSQDGTSITFATNRNQQVFQDATYFSTVYEANVDGSMTVILGTNDRQIIDWWNGITVRRESEPRLSWLRLDGSQSTLDLCQNSQLLGTAHKRSYSGNLVVASNCSDNGWMFYWANPDGTIIDQLLDSPISIGEDSFFNLTWSTDDQYLAFVSLDTASPDVTETLYVLNVAKAREDPSVQLVKMTNSFSPSWQPIPAPELADNSAELKIDPQSCKPASELNSGLQPPNELYSYELIQGTSLVDGDFSYEFWLYCDPALKPDDNEHFSSVAGLGVYASWRYDGPQVEGTSQDYFGFEPVDKGKSFTQWIGPLYKASADERFGMLAEEIIREHIRAGTPIQFSVMVDSPLGQNGATFSFHLEPTENGLRIVDLQAKQSDTAYQGLIAFTSEQNGNYDIYTMRADGGEITNITNNPANDYSPLWSPDGQKIVFISERTGNADIFSMDPDGGNLSQLTDNPGTDGSFSWSPDGQRLVYQAFSKDNPNISQLMIMNLDGSNQAALTPEPGPYGFLSWSPDGQKIVYSKLSPDNTIEDGYYVISVDDQPLQERPVNHNSYIPWEDSEHFLVSGWNGVSEQPRWVVRRFNINGELPLQPSEVASHGSPVAVFFNNTYVVESGTTLTWYPIDGNPTSLKSWEFTTQCERQGDPFIQETNHSISPDGTRAFVTVYCFEGKIWFYIENADDSEFKQLTNFSVATSQVNDATWSPDGNYVLMAIVANEDGSKTDLYLFDIEKMLIDPSTQPIRLTVDEAWKSDAVWQPTP